MLTWLVTDDAAQHAQDVHVPEETRLLGELQVEHNDDDDDSLFEGKLKVMFTRDDFWRKIVARKIDTE